MPGRKRKKKRPSPKNLSKNKDPSKVEYKPIVKLPKPISSDKYQDQINPTSTSAETKRNKRPLRWDLIMPVAIGLMAIGVSLWIAYGKKDAQEEARLKSEYVKAVKGYEAIISEFGYFSYKNNL